MADPASRRHRSIHRNSHCCSHMDKRTWAIHLYGLRCKKPRRNCITMAGVSTGGEQLLPVLSSVDVSDDDSYGRTDSYYSSAAWVVPKREGHALVQRVYGVLGCIFGSFVAW